MALKLKIVILLITLVKQTTFGWGFHGHKLINKHAVYSLPNNALFAFFKKHIETITDRSVNPDKRRYIIESEACRHYIDFEAYLTHDSAQFPKYYPQALAQYTEDSLHKHGILPWNVFNVQKNLTKAMASGNADAIVALAADLGHYVGDANVPLHTTHNYDGQLTNQKGIHALWETRLPELFASDYDYLVGIAQYEKDVQARAWLAVHAAHAGVDSVLRFESVLSKSFPNDQKYGFEERNTATLKLYSKAFSEQYAQALNGQVERQLVRAIKMTADLWYTSWIDAGQPDLSKLLATEKPQKEEPEKIKNERFLESRHSCTHEHYTLSSNK